MQGSLEVLFSPAEFAALKDRDLSQAVCVVFDVLRATSSMVTALANGATAILPVAEIAEALRAREVDPRVLLAGERDGLRITGAQTGGPEFDLGNSPREFAAEIVRGCRIAITTTNGTRALRACAPASTVLAASFLNLAATARFLSGAAPQPILIVCSGTFEEAAYEDILGAGALCDLLWSRYAAGAGDSAHAARQLFQFEHKQLLSAVAQGRNGKRLLSRPSLREDVAFCLQRDVFDFVVRMGEGGWLRADPERPKVN